jgi:peptide/nickel transport system substrate-binding protein
MRTIIRFLTAAVLALLAVAAHAGPGKVLRYASQFDPGSMDPHAIASVYNNRVLSQIYETLVARDEQFKPEARLALSWSPLDGGKGWRFKLRPNVKFHDGTPFSADDVVFNVERALSATSAYKTAVPSVTGARKVDDLTVDILTSQATPTLPLSLTNLRMMSKAWCAKHHCEKPQDYKAKEETFAARNTNGTGPFMLVKWETDIDTALGANPSYWGRKGNLTEVHYRVVTSAATRVSGLLSGELDFVIDPAVQDLDRLRQVPGIKVEQAVGTSTQFLGFDYRREKSPFRDRRVRDAVRHALDLAAIRDKVMRGTATIGRSFWTPLVDGYDARFADPVPFDPARAKALLKEAGYPNGFEVDLDCSSQQPADSIGQAVSAMLARVGIRVNYHPLPFNQLLPKLVAGDTSFYVIGWTPTSAEAEGVLVPLVRTPLPGSAIGEYNFGRYSNPKVDALIDEARVEFDEAKRRALFARIMGLMDEDAAFVPLNYRKVTWVMRKNVRAVLRPNDILDLRFVNMD